MRVAPPAGLGLDCRKPAPLLHFHSAWPGWGFGLSGAPGGGRERGRRAQHTEAALAGPNPTRLRPVARSLAETVLVKDYCQFSFIFGLPRAG
jgi:hypothetical protein